MDPSKDVEAQLLGKRVRRRRPGEVPYPLEYTTELLNFDNWDNMFLFPHSNTIHQFLEPPSMVLDLGCGGGFWILEAAKEWKDTTFIGFDIKDIQPKLENLEAYRDIAPRVQWMHGNLLETLPFPSQYFDLVRILWVGLGVPEDEWQYVFEEVSRVLKPGGILEIVEEDLIFPCGSPSIPQSPTAPTLFSTPPSSPFAVSGPSTTSLTSEPSTISAASTQSNSSSRSLLKHVTFEDEIHPDVSEDPLLKTEEFKENCRDHAKLKASWDAMLSRRFIAPQILSVLPFYLSSSFFEIRTCPALHVPLPPNSSPQVEKHQNVEANVVFDFKATAISDSQREDCHRFDQSTSAPMHLGKVVKTIIACKESIWVEYEELYGKEITVPLVTRTARPAEIQSMPKKNPVREEFERLWSNWENDMMDRIGVRNHICSEFMWSEPVGERPDWRVWRDNIKSEAIEAIPEPTSPSQNLCRSLRGFVAWKLERALDKRVL